MSPCGLMRDKQQKQHSWSSSNWTQLGLIFSTMGVSRTCCKTHTKRLLEYDNFRLILLHKMLMIRTQEVEKCLVFRTCYILTSTLEYLMILNLCTVHDHLVVCTDSQYAMCFLYLKGAFSFNKDGEKKKSQGYRDLDLNHRLLMVSLGCSSMPGLQRPPILKCTLIELIHISNQGSSHFPQIALKPCATRS